MSITSDIRTYADTAIEQGKQVVGQAGEQASQLVVNGITKANDLRVQAEKTLKVDSVRGAVEPYLTRAVATAETLTGVVIETVQVRVVKPVASLTGRGSKPAATRTSAAKPAATRPAKKAPVKKTPARKAPAKKTTAKSTTAKKATS